MRVRNIFICSGVVFCASSRMMNELFSVRPRMKASGAISITPRSMQRRPCRTPSCRRARRRSAAGRGPPSPHVAGQEAEPLAGLDRRPRQDDALDLVARARRPPGHGEVGLARARRADAEGDVVLLDAPPGTPPASANAGAPGAAVRSLRPSSGHGARGAPPVLVRSGRAARLRPSGDVVGASCRRVCNRSGGELLLAPASPSNRKLSPRRAIADVERVLDLAQVLVENAAQVGENAGCRPGRG